VALQINILTEMLFAVGALVLLGFSVEKNCHKNIVNMHRLHDVWQFSETSLKHRIVKN
jgi:hypothetical protein